MPFIFLLLFGLICLQTSWPEPPDWLTPEASALLVGTMVVASWLLAELIALAFTWQMVRHPERRSSLMRRCLRWRRYHFIGLLLAYLTSLYLLGWGHVFVKFWNEWIPRLCHLEAGAAVPGLQIGLLGPFFAALTLSWERFYQVEKAAHELTRDEDPFIRKRTYLLLQIRHQLLLVMPPIVLMFLMQIASAFFQISREGSYFAVLVTTALTGAAFISMPLLLRVFLGLTPLPPGPLRDRLSLTARRLRFGHSNILVWHTHDLFANALVTGFVPWVRYIVLTDRLIDELTPEEIEAVFGHEIGHIKHHHLLFYLALILASLLLLGLVWESAQDQDWFVLDDTVASFVQLGVIAAYMLAVFGFFSRRCERQADLYGSKTVSTDAFISALEKVAAINGIRRDRWSWLHPSIAKRVEFLERMRDHPDQVPRFQRGLLLLKCTYFVLLGGLLLWQFDVQKILSMIKEF